MSCCGSSSVSSPLHTTPAFATAGPAGEPEVYEVTYPTGAKQDFDSETEAYQAIRLTGGGVRRKPRA